MSSGNFLPGIYDQVQSKRLESFLEAHPELRSIFSKIDPEEEPSKYSAFVSRFVEAALRQKTSTADRLALCNELLEKIFSLVGPEKPLYRKGSLENTPFQRSVLDC